MNKIISRLAKLSVIIIIFTNADVFSCLPILDQTQVYNGCPLTNTKTQVLENNDLITIREYVCSTGEKYSIADTSSYTASYNSINSYFASKEFYVIKPVATFVNKDASLYDEWVNMNDEYMQYPYNTLANLQMDIGYSKSDLCNDLGSYKYALYCNSLLKSDTVNVDNDDVSYIGIFKNTLKNNFGEIAFNLPYVLFSDISLTSTDAGNSKYAFVDSMSNFAVCPAGQNQYYTSKYWIVFFDSSSNSPTNQDMKTNRFPIKYLDGSFYIEKNGISFNLRLFNDRFPLAISKKYMPNIGRNEEWKQYKFDLLGRTWANKR